MTCVKVGFRISAKCAGSAALHSTVLVSLSHMNTVLSQGASHRNAGLQPLLHAHVVREDEALERQSESSAPSTAVLQQEHESCALARSADKRREVGKGLSLADTQTGR